MRFVEGILAGAAFLIVALALMPDPVARRLTVRNYRGVAVPAVLGPALAAVAVVVPGRAMKAFLAVMAVLMLYLPTLPFALLLGAAGVALRVDLRERAMLGDAGSNLLGFAIGLGLALRLPTWQLAIAAAAVVALNLLAETVTLSRLIEAAAPLRWLDRLGRLGRREPRTAPRG